MQEKKISSKNKVTTHTFTGFSGASLYTSAGQGIQAITFNESNIRKEKVGTVVFTEDTIHAYMNFCINYKNEHGHDVYIRLTAPRLTDKNGDLLPPKINILPNEAYTFSYSQLWKKVYDGEHKIGEYYD